MDRFQDSVRFSIFRTYPEFETLSRFREKNLFHVLEYTPQFKTKLTFITHKRNQ